MKLNLPNKLTLMRVCLIPLFMFFVIFPVLGDVVSPIVAAVIFILTALTDMLDGKIARKYNLITDFGKFLDPLADKLLVFGGLIAILAAPGFRGTDAETKLFTQIFVWATFIIILRELAVTSMRLVVSSGAKIVIAAGWLGKVKTVTQMITMVILLIEPVVSANVVNTHNAVSYVFLAASVVMTVWSGLSYFAAYWPHINPSK